MNTRNVLIAGILVVVLGLFGAWWLMRPGSGDEIPPGPDPEARIPATNSSAPLDAVRSEVVELYFPAGEVLYPENYEIPAEGSIEKRMMAVLDGLVAGPKSENLQAPLPDGVRAGAVFLLDEIAFVDLVTLDAAPFPSTGSQREMLIAYSLVHSLVANFDEVKAVVLLLNGRQPATLAGHLDTTRPLPAQPQWVAR